MELSPSPSGMRVLKQPQLRLQAFTLNCCETQAYLGNNVHPPKMRLHGQLQGWEP